MDSITGKINPVNKKQAIIGSLLLLAGIMYYLLGRNPDKVYAIHSIHWLYALNLYKFNIFNNYIHDVSPSLIHSCSFTLLTCAFLPTVSKKRYCVVCSLWAAIGCMFELSQLYKPTIPDIYFDTWGVGPLLKLTFDYFKYGTYDVNDIVFTILGSVIAYVILLLTINGGKNVKVESTSC